MLRFEAFDAILVKCKIRKKEFITLVECSQFITLCHAEDEVDIFNYACLYLFWGTYQVSVLY